MSTVNKDFIVKNGVVAGSSVQGTQLISTTSSLPPLSVTSSAVVDNLNVNYLEGYTVAELLAQSGVTSISGTTNEIEVSASVGDIVVGLPNNITVGGDLTVTGGLTVNGTTTTVNSTTVTVDDPIFTLGGDGAGIDDSKDRGIEFKWSDGSAKVGFFGFDDSTGKFTFIPDATNTAEVFSGTKGTLDAYIDWADVTNKPDPTITLNGDVSGAATLTDLNSASITVTVEKDFSLTFTGDVTGAGTVSNLGSASIALTLAANSIALGTDTTGNYVDGIYGTENQISVAGSGTESASVVLSLPQDIATTSTPEFAGVSFANGRINSSTVTVTQNSTPTTIDSFSTTNFTTAEYVIQAKQGSKMTSTKVIVMWDGTNVYVSEYAVIDSSAGAANVTISASESSGTVSVTAESLDAASTNVVIKAVRIALEA